jgi:hypothetical protein
MSKEIKSAKVGIPVLYAPEKSYLQKIVVFFSGKKHILSQSF